MYPRQKHEEPFEDVPLVFQDASLAARLSCQVELDIWDKPTLSGRTKMRLQGRPTNGVEIVTFILKIPSEESRQILDGSVKL